MKNVVYGKFSKKYHGTVHGPESAHILEPSFLSDLKFEKIEKWN